MQGRFITTAVVALAAMAIGPAYAAAATLTDNDFTDGTAASTWAIEPGVLRLQPAVSANFDGTALPTDLIATPWDIAMLGSATVSGGKLTVDGARVNDLSATPTFGAPQILEFRAAFGGDAAQHIGFGDKLEDGPWAIFSTGDGSGLVARTRTAPGAVEPVPVKVSDVIPGFDATLTHTYRIEWSTDDVKFYVDNTLIPTVAAQIPGPMRPVVSDYTLGLTGIKVDWLAMGPSPSSGTFTSRVLAASNAHTVWGTLTSTGVATGTTFEARSGTSPTFDSSTWSDWKTVGNGGAIQSPGGRQYIQYKATLGSATASLDSVAIDYTIDSTAPSAAIDGVQVSGTAANVTFSSPASDVDGFECSIDGAAYAACSSPKQLTGLVVGSHSIFVRAHDKAGNTGTAVSKSFVVDPPASGGSTTGGSGAANSAVVAVDKTAPTVSVLSKSLRASKRGTVSVKVGCPATEKSCKITLQLRRGSSVVAHKTVTVLGGKTTTVTLQLAKATRKQLASHRSLKVTAMIKASDAVGNKQTTKRSLTLRAR